jgi:hypothetical protein
MSRDPLFDRVVAASGLAAVIAGPAMRRALSRAGVDPASMTALDLERALVSIETSLQVYLPPSRVTDRMQALRGLARAGGLAGT